MKVLFIGTEPEAAAKADVAVRLRWVDAKILVAGEPELGLELVEREQPDVVLLQAGSSLNGFIEELRAFSDVPLVVLESEGGGEYLEEIKALESGADEYIRHSASIIDLVARLVALIRRAQRANISGPGQPLSSGALTLDPVTYEVFLDGKRLSLTSTEFKILHTLLNNRGGVVTHDSLSSSLWGDQVDSSSLVKKYIQRLRAKLGDTAQNPQWIASVHGVGYRLLGARAGQEEKAAVPV